MKELPFVPYRTNRYELETMRRRGHDFLDELRGRRSIRHFSDEVVPRELVETAILAASTAPSGANKQPWKFVAINDPRLKHEIRVAAEEEERQFYERRATPEWLEDLRPLGTNWEKEFLDVVPWIVVVFAETYSIVEGEKRKHYYVQESVGLACGLFIAALHRMGLCTLTHTPSPMGFLNRLLERPKNERPFILFPIGFPAPDATVPDIGKKSLEEVSVWKTRE